MEVFVGIIIGYIICLILIAFSGFEEDNELLNQIHEEKQQNRDLREDLDNAELRATEFARKIKAVEDIIVKGKNTNEFDTIILSKIKKELFSETNQDK